jgi:hypothetical protein
VFGVETRALTRMPKAFGIATTASGKLPDASSTKVGASNSMTSRHVVEFAAFSNVPRDLAFETWALLRIGSRLAMKRTH